MSKYSNSIDLSELDIEILEMLNKDDRISYRQLAKELGNKSPVTIKKHIEDLEDKGIIKDYSVNLDYEKLGYEIIAIIEITIDKGKMLEVEHKIAQNPKVFAVYDITGEHDALILARFKTRADLSTMIKKIHELENVERTNTHIVLNVIKEGNSFVGLLEKENK